jgi:hypothetical protein
MMKTESLTDFLAGVGEGLIPRATTPADWGEEEPQRSNARSNGYLVGAGVLTVGIIALGYATYLASQSPNGWDW